MVKMLALILHQRNNALIHSNWLLHSLSHLLLRKEKSYLL